MPDTPTPRLELPAPIGSDPAAVPKDIQALAKRLDEVVLAYGQGPLASRPTGTQGFLYFAIDTKTAYYCTAPGTWQSVTPLDAGGDLGGTWPTPAVAKLSGDNLPVHANGERRLVCERRTFSPAGSPVAASLGTLSHQGAHVTVTIATAAGNHQSTARYEVPVRSASTGWCQVTTPTAAAPGATTTSTTVALHAQEVTGQLSLRAYVLSTETTVNLTVTIDAQGRGLAWAPTTTITPGTASTVGGWPIGGPVGPPVMSSLPTSSYEGQEVALPFGTPGSTLRVQRRGSEWLIPGAGLRYVVPGERTYTDVGSRHEIFWTSLFLPWAGEWELTARFYITGTTGAVIQALLGIDGQLLNCGSAAAVSGVAVAAAVGPMTVTAPAVNTRVIVGVTAPGFTTSGKYSVAEIIARPRRMT
jgi:hypothetical protein